MVPQAASLVAVVKQCGFSQRRDTAAHAVGNFVITWSRAGWSWIAGVPQKYNLFLRRRCEGGLRDLGVYGGGSWNTHAYDTRWTGMFIGDGVVFRVDRSFHAGE